MASIPPAPEPAPEPEPAPVPTPAPVSRSQPRDPEFRMENTPYEKRLPSCAECRRLKRRCDRKWPCQSCIARGCASICPNGSLSTEGSGSRSILRKIKEMSKRIGQLEDALTAIWHGPDTHPLLRPELLKIKSLPDTSANTNEDDEEAKQPAKVKTEDEADALATDLDSLTLGTNGKMNYMGRTAKYEFILKAEELDPTRTSSTDHPSPPADVPSPAPSLPQSITDLSHSFLLTAPLRTEVTLSELQRYLPSFHRAQNLVDFFYTNAGWFYSPAPRDEFLEDVFASFYPYEYSAATRKSGTSTGATTAPSPTRSHSAHDLALLFLVLAFAMQLEAPYATHSEDSEVYQTLSRAALAMEPITNGCSLSLIQTLELMVYRSHFDHNNAQAEFLWGVMGLATKFALTLGLHRDCAQWELPPKEVNQRRYVFWELFSCNAWTALGSGRPPALQLSHTDCQMPSDPAERTAHSGKVTNRSFYNWKHIFTRDILWPVIELNYNLNKTFSYSAILELDRKVREFDMGSFDRESLRGNGKNPNPNVGLLLQRWINKNCKDHIILHMHRVFFARALSTHPDSPLDSPYSSSVLAAFKCAVSLLQDVELIYEQAPPEFIPFGISWSYVLSCGMTMGTLCSKGPRGPLAPYAFERLKASVQLAQTRFGRSQRAVKGIPMLQNLLTAAAAAITPLGPGPVSGISSNPVAAAQVRTILSLHRQTTPPEETSSNGSTSGRPRTQEELSLQTHSMPLPSDGWQQQAPIPQSDPRVNPVVASGLPIPSPELHQNYDPLFVPQPQQQLNSLYIPPESDFTTFTLHHQPTTSYRPLGMPIPPDDYVWSEPPHRPLKRYRYSDESLPITTSVAPVYPDLSGGDTSPQSARPPLWQGHLSNPAPPHINVYHNPPQWSQPPLSSSPYDPHGYTGYDPEPTSSTDRQGPHSNLHNATPTGPYGGNPVSISWNPYLSQHVPDPSNQGTS